MCGCGNSSPTGMLSAASPRATGGKQVNSGMPVSCRHWSPELATYHVAFTTPYVLLGSTKKDWIDFLRRNMVGIKASSEAEALH